MATGPEAKLWKALKGQLDAKNCFSTRIENRNGGGIPDVDVVSPHGAFKIELKITDFLAINLSDMQIAYNTALNCKFGLSFILAEDPGRIGPCKNARSTADIGDLFASAPTKTQDRGPRSGSGRAADRARSGRVGAKGEGRVGSGRAYYLWHGRDALLVARSGLRAEYLAASDSLSDIVAVMLAVSAEHVRWLAGKGPGF